MNAATQEICKAIPSAVITAEGGSYEVSISGLSQDAGKDFLTVYNLLSMSPGEWNLKFTLKDNEKAILMTASSSLDVTFILESVLLLNHALEREPSNIMIDVHTGICRMVSENYFDSDSDQAYMTSAWQSGAKRMPTWVNPPAVVRHVA